MFALPGSVIEGDTGTTALVIPVFLLPPASGNVTVNYTTSGITATPGVDFTPVSGTLTFPAGSTTQNHFRSKTHPRNEKITGAADAIPT